MATEKKNGFEISVDQAWAFLTIRVWGFWDRELARQFKQACQAKVKEFDGENKNWQVLIDFMNSPVQLPEVLEIIREGLQLLKDQRIHKKAVLVKNSITHFQADTLFRGNGLQIYSYFRSEQDALQWLLGEVNS